MKKRLISLLLAFSMMLTFLPAGAVSAFAEENIGGRIAGGATITTAGTYQLYGNYNQGITINTTGSVVINVTGNVTVTAPENVNNFCFIIIEKADSVTINDAAKYPVTVNGGSVISNLGEELIVNGGKYICSVRNYYSSAFNLSNGSNRVENVTIESKYNAILVSSECDSAVIKKSEITKQYNSGGYEGGIVCRTTNGTLDLDHVTVHALEGSALRAESGTITINGGEYKSNQGAAIATWYNSDDNLDLTINGGTYQSDNYNGPVANFGCNVGRTGRDCNIKIHGGTFVGGQLLWFRGEGAKTLTIDKNTTFQSTGGEYDAVVVGGHGQLFFNSGTIDISGGSERNALRIVERGEAIVNDGTFKGAKYDIYERNNDSSVPPSRVQLNHANFDDTVCNVYLEEDRQIDVAQNYTGEVTIECADPKDGRQLTKATKTDYQEKLNLTSANAGYLVGYKKTEDGKEYRCLFKKVGVTISGLEGDIKAEEPAEFTVTLDHAGSTGTGILTFGDKNGEIEYQDDNGVYHPMPPAGREIDLESGKNQYTFHITPKNAGDQKLTAAVVRDAVKLGTAEENFTVAGRVHTTVTIEGLEDAVIKEGESKDFTVKVTPNDDVKLGEAFIDFGNKNSEIEYKDENDEYKPMPEGGLPINLASNNNDYAFRIIPQKAGDQKLTAAVVRDAVKLGTAEENFTVAGRVHTTVTIEGLEDAVIKEGESKDFTVKVTPNDDAKLGEAFINFGNKNSEIEYKDKTGAYQRMPEGGLKIGLGDGEVEKEFRITPKETGKQTLTAAVKKDEKELATDEKDFVVSEMPILTLKDGVITSVTVPGKDGADPEDITEIVKKNANEDGSFHVPEGATVSVAFDKDAFADSGLKFGHWDITGLDDPNAYQDKESFAFEMPAKAVTLKAMTQDASIEDDEPDIVGPIVIGTTVVVGGAVLGYQAYSLGAEFAGKLMALPYFPSNRSALAMMLWEDAGKPMPESELLYPDVGQEERDMDLQHAARWAMENELIPDLNDEGTAPEEMKFYPDNTVSKIDVLKAWQKAQELKQNA